MNSKSYTNIFLAFLLLITYPVQAGFFSSLWSGVKSVGTWVHENKELSLVVASCLLGAGIVYGYRSGKSQSSSSSNNDQQASKTKTLDNIPEGSLSSDDLLLPEQEKKKKKEVKTTKISTSSQEKKQVQEKLSDKKNTVSKHSSLVKLFPFLHRIPAAVLSKYVFPAADILEQFLPLNLTRPHKLKENDWGCWYGSASGNSAVVVCSTTTEKENMQFLPYHDDDRATRVFKFPIAAFKKKNRAVMHIDSKRVLTAHDDGTACLWDITGKKIDTFIHDSGVTCAKFDRNGKRILTVTKKGIVYLWDIRSKKILATFEYTGEIDHITFNYDETSIVSKSFSGLWLKNPHSVQMELAVASLSRSKRLPQVWDISLLSKKLQPEQAAFMWLCKEQHDKYKKVSFEVLAEEFKQQKVTTNDLKKAFESFTDREQEVLIDTLNITDARR